LKSPFEIEILTFPFDYLSCLLQKLKLVGIELGLSDVSLDRPVHGKRTAAFVAIVEVCKHNFGPVV
jgi:hypothetical protein